MSGSERAAILLMSLGEDDASAVLKLMDPKEVEKVALAMASINNVSQEKLGTVMEDFGEAVDGQTTIGLGVEDYMRSTLTNAVGEKRAEGLLDRVLAGRSRGLESLKWMETKTIADLVQQEHPQIVAIVLAHLEADQSGEILAALPAELRNDVVLRIAALQEIPHAALEELDTLMSQRSDEHAEHKQASVGGLKVAADIINSLGKDEEESVMEYLREVDEEMTDQISELMFSFDMLLSIDDRGIQALLREITNDQLITSLKGADPAIQDKIFSNMSKRAAEMVRDDLEAKGPVRLSEVDDAQKDILSVVRRMADDGTISLGGKGDEFV